MSLPFQYQGTKRRVIQFHPAILGNMTIRLMDGEQQGVIGPVVERRVVEIVALPAPPTPSQVINMHHPELQTELVRAHQSLIEVAGGIQGDNLGFFYESPGGEGITFIGIPGVRMLAFRTFRSTVLRSVRA
jgi:hypothetical protein